LTAGATGGILLVEGQKATTGDNAYLPVFGAYPVKATRKGQPRASYLQCLLWTPSEAAAWAGVSYRTICRWRKVHAKRQGKEGFTVYGGKDAACIDATEFMSWFHYGRARRPKHGRV